MDDELWYGVIENLVNCSYSALYLSIFQASQDKFALQFFSAIIEARHFIFSIHINNESYIVGLKIGLLLQFIIY